MDQDESNGERGDDVPDEERRKRKERAASIRKQIEELRAGKRRRPTTPREFVDQQTPGEPAEEEPDNRHADDHTQ